MKMQSLLGLALCGVVCAAGAVEELKGLGDPTRPPAGLVRNVAAVAAANGASGPAAAMPAASAASAPVLPPPRLQAIRLNTSTGQGVAMINDEVVQPGDRLKGGWTLLAIQSDSVVLAGPKGRLNLSLLGTSSIDKDPVAPRGRQGRKE